MNSTVFLLLVRPSVERAPAGSTSPDRLSDYQFGKKRIHHLFCANCGIRSFARGTGPDGKEMVAVNVRCLENVDPSALAVTPFDGRSL